MNNFNKIINKLKNLNENRYSNTPIKSYSSVFIPSIWANLNHKNGKIQVDFVDFLLQQCEKILSLKSEINASKNPNIYNLLARLTTAFDHNQDGKIENKIGEFKETGTFLKTIALLPYFKKLGVNILYLLPITSIGKDGKKGDLGSPYSISNPYKIDENLNELLLEMSIEEQFSAFIEAAHHIGIKVVSEFIFRTSSKDSLLAIEHPEWFYWIKNEIKDKNEDKIKNEETVNENSIYYCSPEFTNDELINIKAKIGNYDFKNLPEPNLKYQQIFTEPPKKVEIINEKLIGTLENGETVRIPGAFADWPPDDIQPTWSDVTYLKLYSNPDFNYIAYNTVRMYDEALIQARYEATDLWKHIENIIPYYQEKFGIDGVMIDMGHALPKKLLNRIIAKARNNNPNFLFWEENFVPNEDSLKEGFNLVLGYLPFDQHKLEKMKIFIENVEKFPIPCFATPETHNTPRAALRNGGIKFSKIAYLVNYLLPISTFIHSGFELGETLPLNTGLGFEEFDTRELTVDKLPLFSTFSFNWLDFSQHITDFIFEVNQILSNKIAKTANSTKLLYCNSENILAFTQKSIVNNIKYLLLANYSEAETKFELKLDFIKNLSFILGENKFSFEQNTIYCELSAFGFVLLEICE